MNRQLGATLDRKQFFKAAAQILFLLFFPSLCAGEFRWMDGSCFCKKVGMFAVANEILGQLSIYESKDPVEIEGFLVDFGTYGLYYEPTHGPNWWSYYFEPLCLGNIDRTHAAPLAKELYFEGFKKRQQLKRTQAAQIVKKYIHVKESVLRKVESFVSRYFNGIFTIGVHYRGTDKGVEASPVSYEKVFQSILARIPPQGSWQIFVATDEIPFLKAIQLQFPGRVVACDAIRSEGKLGVHFLSEEGYRKGEEALIDALLLSRCQLLIRTSSNLSLWSTYFNPDLPTVLLNLRFRSRQNAEPE